MLKRIYKKATRKSADLPMTPLTTLRTAQLFQISWPRISSTVGILIGSIGGFSESLEVGGSREDLSPEVEAIEVEGRRKG